MGAQIILELAILILVAKIFGELAEKIKLPPLIGELFAGILLGPYVLNFAHPSELLYVFGEIGIILLIFIAGFEHGSIKELLKYKKTSMLVSALSSTLPIVGVVALTQMQGFSMVTSLFLAVALGATSMGVSLRSLMGIKEVDSKVGKTVMGSLVLNDITGLILLTVVVTYAEISTGGSANILLEVGKSILSILVCFGIFYLGVRVLPKMTHWFITLKVEEAQFSFAIIIILISSWAAQTFGLSTIIGAFVAGIILSKSPVFETHNFHQKISSLSYGFFIPIFFAFTGTQLAFDNFFANLIRALMFFGIITTIQVGCAFIASKLNKYTSRESLLVGFAMLPYGEVTLVVMSALITLSTTKPEFFIGQDIQGLFSSALLLILLTVVMTPVFMKLVNKIFRKEIATMKSE